MGTIRGKARWAAGALMTICAVLACAGCAPQAADSTKAENPHESPIASVDFTWSPDSDCSMCHADEAKSLQDSTFPAAVHEREAVECATCHGDESKLSAAHEGALPDSEMPTRLKSTAVAEQVCLDCHDDAAALAQATAGSTALVDSEGTAANPHALPDSEDHEGISCSDCHKMHSSDPVDKTAMNACLSCHHEGVFECYTCHE